MQTSKHGARRARYLAIPLLLALAVLLSATHETHAQEEDTADGEITFVRLANGEPGGEGIYIINADGSDERPLFLFEDIGLPYDIENGGYRCPVWSPDGTQLAFNGAEGDTTYLVVLDVESGDTRRVYEVQHDDQTFRSIYFPEWVPDSDYLSFGFTESERSGVVQVSGIRMVSLDGEEVITLRDDIDLTINDSPRTIGGPLPNFTPFSHSWSPDGSQLALASYNWRTYLMDEDGGNLREINAQWANGDVEWSPDGESLAVSLFRMVLVKPNDDTERELVPMGETFNGSTVESLSWSPDGSEIAYTTMWSEIVNGDFTTTFSLSVVDPETAEIRELIRTPSFTGGDYPYNISCVDWHPKGQ